MVSPIGIVFVLMVFVYNTECAKILGIFHIPGTSHYMAGNTLMKILAEKGHEVTIVSPFIEKNPPKNYKQIYLDGIMEAQQKTNISMFDINSSSPLVQVIFSFVTNSMVEAAFQHAEFQKLMNSNEKYDAVIIEEFQSPAMKYVGHHFNAPVIVYYALDANHLVSPYHGNPSSPAYVPSLFLPYTTNMSFFQRVKNTMYYVLSNIILNFLVHPLQNRMLHRYYPDAPHLSEMAYNTSLLLLNADPSTHEPIPKVPSMINIGGFHVRKPKPLPEDLQELLDKAENGVVYFSMGSNLKSKDIPVEKREMIMRTFSTLKETVLWKFEDENLPGKSENIVVRKWLPQNDILAHKNIKLFITHGGIFSTYEAIYHGVPLLAIPVSAEQQANAQRAALGGYAEYVPYREMTEDTFKSLLNKLLHDPKYGLDAKKRSNIMKDKPRSQADTLAFWVEYVIRHKGADHLRVSALNLAWYQYLLLDVSVFLLASVVISFYLLRVLAKLLLKRKDGSKQKTQ